MQLRTASRLAARICERLDAAGSAALRCTRELIFSFGALTLRASTFLGSGTDAFRVDVDENHRLVRVVLTAKRSFVIAFCDLRVFGASRPATSGDAHDPGAADRRGRGLCAPTIVSRLVRHRRNAGPPSTLAKRERDILELMAEGHSNQGICDRLFLSPKTVEGHINNLSRLDN